MKTRKMTALLLAGAMFLGGGFAVPQTVKAADNPVSSRVQTLYRRYVCPAEDYPDDDAGFPVLGRGLDR